MKTIKIFSIGLALMASMTFIQGCALFSDPPPAMSYERIATTAVDKEQLKLAIINAATRRRWTPDEISDGYFRCVIVQRSNRVEIELKINEDGKTYSITPISYNIPSKKVDQWTNNLQREIQKQIRSL